MRLALALGVPVAAIVNSYQEVYGEHSYFIRCMVERELVTSSLGSSANPSLCLPGKALPGLCTLSSPSCPWVLPWCTFRFTATSQMSLKHRILEAGRNSINIIQIRLRLSAMYVEA